MSNRIERREVFIERMADHVLSVGLAGAKLRSLAAAAGTSDRMLLYYFADKDEMMIAILECISERLLEKLNSAIPLDGLRPFPVLIQQVWNFINSDSYKPYMHIWLDLASSAARGLQPHLGVAGAIAEGYLAWVTSRLASESADVLSSEAALLLATIEGMYMLKAIGRTDIANLTINQLSVLMVDQS